MLLLLAVLPSIILIGYTYHKESIEKEPALLLAGFSLRRTDGYQRHNFV